MGPKLFKISLIILVLLGLVLPNFPLKQIRNQVSASENEVNRNQLDNELFFDRFGPEEIFTIFPDQIDNSWWGNFF